MSRSFLLSYSHSIIALYISWSFALLSAETIATGEVPVVIAMLGADTGAAI
jgi:hypothetical protein